MHKNHRNPKDKPRRDTFSRFNGYGERQYYANLQNRQRRREDRKNIRNHDWDAIRTIEPFRDKWVWW